MKIPQVSFLAGLVLLSASQCIAGQDLILQYDLPAADWERHALPIGNGRMGAMFFGGTTSERVQFNEISLWTGSQDLMGAYQAFGNLYIHLPGHDRDVNDYRRWLDLAEGIGHLRYKRSGVTFHREYLASHPAQGVDHGQATRGLRI